MLLVALLIIVLFLIDRWLRWQNHNKPFPSCRVEEKLRRELYANPLSIYVKITDLDSSVIRIKLDCALSHTDGFLIDHNGEISRHQSGDITLALKPGKNHIQMNLNIPQNMEGFPLVQPAYLTLTRDGITGKNVLTELRTGAPPKCIRAFPKTIDATTTQWVREKFPFLFDPDQDDFSKASKLSSELCERQGKINDLGVIVPAYPLPSAWDAIAVDGAGMRCRDKAVWFRCLLNIAGIHSRLVSLFPQTDLLLSRISKYLTIPSHVTVEVFSRNLGKWLIVDPEYGVAFSHKESLLDVMEVYEHLKKGKLLELVYCTSRFKDSIPSINPDNSPLAITNSFNSLFSTILYERDRSKKFNSSRKIPIIGDY